MYVSYVTLQRFIIKNWRKKYAVGEKRTARLCCTAVKLSLPPFAASKGCDKWTCGRMRGPRAVASVSSRCLKSTARVYAFVRAHVNACCAQRETQSSQWERLSWGARWLAPRPTAIFRWREQRALFSDGNSTRLLERERFNEKQISQYINQ